MNYGKIYKITNNLNNMVYVGQTTKTDIIQRFSEHCKETRNNRYISNAIQKYGKENFSIVELAKANSQKELNQLEVHYVKTLNSMYPIGYNHRAGGQQNGICSIELKRKISLAKKGKPNLKRLGEVRSEDQRIKISRGLGGLPIKMTNVKTREVIILQTAHEALKYGINPSNVVQICKRSSGRINSKGFTFEYIKQANQSGSVKTKITTHAQRIEGEPVLQNIILPRVLNP